MIKKERQIVALTISSWSQRSSSEAWWRWLRPTTHHHPFSHFDYRGTGGFWLWGKARTRAQGKAWSSATPVPSSSLWAWPKLRGCSVNTCWKKRSAGGRGEREVWGRGITVLWGRLLSRKATKQATRERCCCEQRAVREGGGRDLGSHLVNSETFLGKRYFPKLHRSWGGTLSSSHNNHHRVYVL